MRSGSRGSNGSRRPAQVVEISLPHTKYALPAYCIVAPAEASSNLARYDRMRYGARKDGDNLTATYEATRASGFGKEVQRRLMIGTYVLSSGYYDAYYTPCTEGPYPHSAGLRDGFRRPVTRS
ncbi:MAG: amidase family protein [Hyphomonas sp.]